MGRIHKLKKHANNPFTKLTGKPAIKLTGLSTCIVVSGKMITVRSQNIYKQTPTKTVAAYLYLKHPEILNDYNYQPVIDTDTYNQYSIEPSDIKVQQSCGIDQCINPDHLSITLKKKNSW